MNALLIISGAFGAFKKETVIAVGGYKTDCIAKDMELVVRLHRKLIEQGRPYKNISSLTLCAGQRHLKTCLF